MNGLYTSYKHLYQQHTIPGIHIHAMFNTDFDAHFRNSLGNHVHEFKRAFSAGSFSYSKSLYFIMCTSNLPSVKRLHNYGNIQHLFMGKTHCLCVHHFSLSKLYTFTRGYQETNFAIAVAH